MIGYVNSVQSLGAVDGPGVRFTVFLQGCPLRCGCCHNPDTWEMDGGTPYTAADIADKAERYREYFGETGGVTLTGGEPLMQAEFAEEVFTLCRERGIGTCLDTSGCIGASESAMRVLSVTDRVLLDIKYTDDEKYRRYVGCGIEKPLEFLGYLNGEGIPTTLRQVIIPELNGDDDNIRALGELARYGCVDTVELLPFKKLCTVKYRELGIPFPFEARREPTAAESEMLRARLAGLVPDITVI